VGYKECCLYCENFYNAILKSSPVLIEFLEILRIIPTETANVSELTRLDNGNHLYEASYLLTGNIITKPIGVEVTTEDGCLHVYPKQLPDGTQFHFTHNINVSITNVCQKPVIQLDIICEIPWVLQKMD
jgi:hypothetical protein